MNQQQYEDMKTIMRLSREFADTAYNLMVRSGLIEQDYELEVKVYNFKHFDGEISTRHIELSPNISRNIEMWRKYRMDQCRYLGKEWEIRDDPYAKKYVAIQDDECEEKANDSEGMAEVTGKHDPLDGVWFSNYDDPPVLDGGQ